MSGNTEGKMMFIFHVVIDDDLNGMFTQMTETRRAAIFARMESYKVKGRGHAKVRVAVYGGRPYVVKFDVTKHASGHLEVLEVK